MPHHRLAYLPKDLKRPIQIRVQHQHRRHILAPIAIIRRRPHRHEVRSREHILEALLHHLMRAADQLQAVRLRELVHRALPEHEPRTAGRLAETVHVVGVRPDQVGEGAGGGDFFGARDGANLGITDIGVLFRTWSIVLMEGERPPWMQRIRLSTSYGRGEEKRLRLRRRDSRRPR